MKPITIIVARDRQGVIGYRGKVPFRLKEDMKLFRNYTKRNNVIMGRKTWDSLPFEHKPLPLRRNIIISRTMRPALNGEYILAKSPQLALMASENIPGETFVIGGSEIYAHFLPMAERLIVTDVHTDLETNPEFTDLFPFLDEDEWEEESKLMVPADIDNQFDFTQRVLRRK